MSRRRGWHAPIAMGLARAENVVDLASRRDAHRPALRKPVPVDLDSSPTPETQRWLESTLLELLPQVRRLAYRLIGPGADFEDAVQDSLVALARALPRFEGRSKVSTFAHPIIVRICYRHLHGRSRHRISDESEIVETLASHTDDPEQQTASRQRLARLHRVLDRLPTKQRVAFILCAVERLPHDEVAKLEDISVDTLRARLKRARAELARRLKADPELVRALRRATQGGDTVPGRAE